VPAGIQARGLVSLLPPTNKGKKKGEMLLHFIKLFKSEKSVIFFWHCLSLSLSEPSGVKIWSPQ